MGKSQDRIHPEVNSPSAVKSHMLCASKIQQLDRHRTHIPLPTEKEIDGSQLSPKPNGTNDIKVQEQSPLAQCSASQAHWGSNIIPTAHWVDPQWLCSTPLPPNLHATALLCYRHLCIFKSRKKQPSP